MTHLLSEQALSSSISLWLHFAFFFVILIFVAFVLFRLVKNTMEEENNLKWADVEKDNDERFAILEKSTKSLANIGIVNPLEMAAVDVFVTKAQAHITHRAIRMLALGLIFMFLAIIIIICTVLYFDNNSITKFISSLNDISNQKNNTSINGYIFMMWLVRGGSLSALALSAVVLCVWLGRAFLHEAIILYNKRHAVRFGRLYLYLKFSNAKDMKDLSVSDMEAAFGWNITTSSAFKDIDTSKFPKNAASPDQLAQIIDSIMKNMNKDNNDSPRKN